jgi:2',3'-cyclic-nucleotide 2'-phosphodiesterase (5'-nucleotidase family)
VTDPFRTFLDGFDYGLEPLDEVGTAREAARSVRDRGAELVVVLSHLGYEVPEQGIDDRRLAAALQDDVDLIVGAHSHHLLPEGERVGNVLIVQAGSHGEHLGRVDVVDGTLNASVLPVTPEIAPDPAVLVELESAEAELGEHLGEVLTELSEPLDEEAAARWLAGIYRERMGADVGLATPGASFEGWLPAGPLTRGSLWEACHSTGNPGVVRMSGEQLLCVLERGRDAQFAGTTGRPLRGKPRGVLQTSGAEKIEPGRSYTVAGCDWELEPYGGMVEADWGLAARYDYPTIVREAIEEHLAGLAHA